MSYQTECIKQFEKEGFTVIKTIRLNKSGYPDLMCMKKGITIWVEVKEPGDTLKPLQKKIIDELIANGFKAFCLKKGKGKIYPLD